jgi:hypothetical protein
VVISGAHIVVALSGAEKSMRNDQGCYDTPDSYEDYGHIIDKD